MSALGQKIKTQIEWVTDKAGTLLGYKRGHQDIEYLAKFQTDVNGNMVLVGPDGLPLDLGVGLTETSPGSGIYLAEVANKVDTAANLRLYAGADGQISAASDVDAIFRHTGSAGAKGYYRSKFVGRTKIEAFNGVAAGGAADTWTTLDFNGGLVVVDDLTGTGVLASDAIIVPAGVDYYDVSIHVPWSENAASGTTRKVRLIADGAASSSYTAITAAILETSVLSTTINASFKHITKTKAAAVTLTLQTLWNGTTAPTLGIGLNVVQFTVDMYRND